MDGCFHEYKEQSSWRLVRRYLGIFGPEVQLPLTSLIGAVSGIFLIVGAARPADQAMAPGHKTGQLIETNGPRWREALWPNLVVVVERGRRQEPRPR